MFRFFLILLLPLSAQGRSDFTTLDRGRAEEFVGLRFDLSQHGGLDDRFIRLEPYGQIMKRRKRIGAYAHLPIALIKADQEEDEMALGNLEIGALLGPRWSRSSFLLRFGVALPTAKEEPRERLALDASAWPRLTDRVNLLPNTTSLRLSASPSARSGAVFFRADFGLDLVMPDGRESEFIMRGNIAVGVDLGPVDLTGEFVNLEESDLFSEEAGEAFLHAFTLAIRHRLLYATITTPLDALPDLICFGVGLESKY